MRLFASVVFATLFISSAAIADLDTFTYVSSWPANNGGGSGAHEGDISAQNPVTILDSDGGDMWNDGDQFAYVHQGAALPDNNSYTATVRVISRTQHIDGRWGKAGIVASENLDGGASTASAQVAFGNGSQAFPNTDGTWTDGGNAVPVRLAGRRDGLGSGFEDNIVADGAYTGPTNGDGHVMNVLETRWLSLSYDAATNEFVAGVARDINGSPGVWSYSAPNSDVSINSSGSHYIGLGYSAHDDLNFDQVTRPDNLHGVTFDKFSIEITVIPEPTAMSLVAFGLLGLLGFRRRNR